MLVEILFKENNTAPFTVITDQDPDVLNLYDTVKKFLIDTMDIGKKEGVIYYILMIEKTRYYENSSDCGFFLPGRTAFSFRCISADNSSTITGSITIDDDKNIINFSRSPAITRITKENKEDTKVLGPGGVRYPADCKISFVNSTQMYNRDDSAKQTTTGGNTVNPIVKLSSDSFDVDEGVIRVSCPEMKIGTVEDSSLRIDEERQAAQNAFLETMTKKHNIQRKKSKN